MAFFLETLLGGLMAGMLYSLVALGFVLIFKASGVFNFAQGAMVLFAALAMARFADPARADGIDVLFFDIERQDWATGGLLWSDKAPPAPQPCSRRGATPSVFRHRASTPLRR